MTLSLPLDDPRQYLTLWWSGWHWYDDDHVLLSGKVSDSSQQEIHLCDLATANCATQSVPPYEYRSLPVVSADQQYAAYVRDEVVIVDMVDESVRFLLPDSRSFHSIPGGEIFWHPIDDWLIIRDDALYAGGASIRWTSVANTSGSIRRELPFCWSSPLCIDWLPPRVDLAHLPPVQERTPITEPRIILRGDHWAWFLSWSPDSTHLLAGRVPQQSHDPAYGGPGKSTLWSVADNRPVSTLPLVDWNEEVHWLTA